jgi:hypothetical protein
MNGNKKATAEAILQLAGKTISAKNAELIVAAKDSIASGLGSLNSVLDAAGITAANDDEVSASNWENSGLIGCGTYEDYMRRSIWHQKLESVLNVFSYYFEASLYYKAQGEKRESDYYGTPEELKTALIGFLKELEDTYEATLSAAAVIQASSGDGEFLTFTVPSLTLIESGQSLLECGNSPNRLPIEGMLFQCDVVSEGIPAKGPGKRLMIPKSVALKSVDQIQSLPLDADPTLRKHCNNSIVGTMLSAQIKPDNGFWIRGNLFPWSQPEIVAEIRASKHEMGFSINAYTRGHDETIAGEVVHVIDELTLVGANILYAESATFSSTQLITANTVPETNFEGKSKSKFASLFLKANSNSTSTNSSQEAKIMEEQLKELVGLVTAQATQIAKLTTVTETTMQGLSILLDERSEREKETLAAAEKQKQEEGIQSVAEKVASLLAPKFNHMTRAGQPPRIVPGALAASVSEDPKGNEIALLQAQLTGLEQSGSFSSEVMQKRISLTNQIASLKAAQ